MSSERLARVRDLLPPRENAAGRRAGCVVIGEVAQAHDGSLGFAHAFIDSIADAGADAVKFQTHIAAAESTPAEPWRVKFSRQDASRYDYWKRMEFSEEHWAGLKRHADDRGLWFLSSPFSLEAVALLKRVGVAAWKIASGEVSNDPLLDAVSETRPLVLLSTGMSGLAEVDRAVERVRSHGAPFAVLQCTSAYPCPPERVGLELIPAFRSRYGSPAGLSDHSGTIYPGLAAAVLGADVIEVHITLSREMFGPDVPASLTPVELAQLVAGTEYVHRMLSSPVDKDASASDMSSLRSLFTKSLVARRALRRGAVFGPDDLTAKKPGSGIPSSRLPDVLGQRLLRDVEPDEILRTEDIEGFR